MKSKHQKYTWDLQPLLSNGTLEKLHLWWLDIQRRIIALYPHFVDSLSNFRKWLSLHETYEVLSNRLNNYVSNNYNEEQTSPKWIAWSQRLNNDANKFHVQLADYAQRVIREETKIRSYLKDSKIKEYQREFELTFRNKPHIISDDAQKALSTMGIINGGFATIFSTLSDTEVKFLDAVDSHRKKVPLLTIADVSFNLKSNDRTLRKTTWINFNKAYSNYENTFTQTLYYNYLMLNTISKIHNHKDYISATAFEDEIDTELILNLYKYVALFKSNFLSYRKVFNQILKKQLQLTKLEPWDRTVNLIKKEVFFTIEETKEIILQALKPLGEEYMNNVKKAFNEQWISWLPKPGKQQGAYSIGGTKGLSKYYISMNFDRTIRSVSTIAHELGHSLNSYYINKKQKVYCEVAIFYAEIASIVNEMLLSYYLLEKYKTDNEMKKMILDEMISNFFSTVSRQIIFSNTEYELNKLVNESQPFTKENIKNIYWQMIEKYQGIDKAMQKKMSEVPYSYAASAILRIPHFYAGNFYVYKYAIGQIVAILVADRIYRGDQGMLKKYFTFLSSGSSLSPIETIKLLGVDLNAPDTYQQTKTIVNDWISKLSKYTGK